LPEVSAPQPAIGIIKPTAKPSTRVKPTAVDVIAPTAAVQVVIVSTRKAVVIVVTAPSSPSRRCCWDGEVVE
jgi:hypothetical protein